jgi:hypothetical protein
MKRVSEFSGHDMAAGRRLPPPDANDMRRDLDEIHNFRLLIGRRKMNYASAGQHSNSHRPRN